MAEASLQVMLGILDKLCGLDKEKFFHHPVTEAVAPNYYKIIKQPMCFEVMRQKLTSKEYRTWKAFVADFELICSNARKYNQQRSRVNKAAVALLRAGKKVLQTAELEGRKAVHLLHPQGPSAAAAEEAAQIAHDRDMLVKEEIDKSEHDVDMTNSEQQHVSNLDSPFGAHDGSAYPGVSFRQSIGSYLSDTEPENETECALRQPSAQSLQQVLKSFGTSVVWESRHPTSVAAYDHTPLNGTTRRTRSAKWREVRRSVEWRCRWLELRMLHLIQIQQHLSSACDVLSSPQQPATIDLSRTGSGLPRTDSSLPHKESLKRELDTDPQQLRYPKRPKIHPQQAPPAISSSIIRSVPFIQHHLHATPPHQVTLPSSQARDDHLPARFHWALDHLAQQVSDIRSTLLQAFGMAGGSARSAGAAEPLGSAGLRKGGRPSRQLTFARLDSLNPNKRRRHESEADAANNPTPSTAKAANITIPPVRQLPAYEVAARLAALTTWKKNWTSEGPNALTRPPEAVQAALANLDEGSSSEDTADDVYYQRHVPHELKERECFGTAGSPQRDKSNGETNKAVSRAAKDKPSGGDVSVSMATDEVNELEEMDSELNSGLSLGAEVSSREGHGRGQSMAGRLNRQKLAGNGHVRGGAGLKARATRVMRGGRRIGRPPSRGRAGQVRGASATLRPEGSTLPAEGIHTDPPASNVGPPL